jgi:hypothetical protein
MRLVVLLLSLALGACSSIDAPQLMRERGPEVTARVWKEAFGRKDAPPVVRLMENDPRCEKGMFWADGGCVGGMFSEETREILLAVESPGALAHELAHYWLFTNNTKHYFECDGGHHDDLWWVMVRMTEAKAEAIILEEIGR